jgi:predicted phage terminase large subunit-like protein
LEGSSLTLDLTYFESDLRRDAVATGGLRAFAKHHWEAAESAAPFVDSWAFGAVCEFLQAFHRREFKTGVIGLPPGNSKSLAASVFFPAYIWAESPEHKVWANSFDIKLVLRDADRFRDVLQSRKYLLDYPDTRLRHVRGAKGELWTTAGGLRFSSTVAGAGTGWHFNTVIIDDPVKPQNVLGASDVTLKTAQRWRDKVVPTRRAAPADLFGLLLIMQRLCEGDMAGEELKRSGVEHLCLPMHYAPKAHWIIGDWSEKLDKRTEPGELLNPERFDSVTVQELETSLGSDASAQLEQNPIPRTGGLLDEAWLRWQWIDIPWRGLWIQEWDLGAKGTDSERHSAVHGALWCACKTQNVSELLNSIEDRAKEGRAESRPQSVAPEVRWHLVDEVHGVWPFEETIRQMVAAQQLTHWNRAMTKRVEEKASGIQALQVLKNKISGLVSSAVATPEHLKDDKLTRFRPLVPPAAEAGLILLPPWYATRGQESNGSDVGPDAFRTELLKFPRGRRDDRVDTTSSMAALFRTRAGSWQESVLKLANGSQNG